MADRATFFAQRSRARRDEAPAARAPQEMCLALELPHVLHAELRFNASDELVRAEGLPHLRRAGAAAGLVSAPASEKELKATWVPAQSPCGARGRRWAGTHVIVGDAKTVNHGLVLLLGAGHDDRHRRHRDLLAHVLAYLRRSGEINRGWVMRWRKCSPLFVQQPATIE